MSGRSRIRLASVLAIVIFASSAGLPLTSAQIGTSDYCPAGDQDHQPPDPPGDGADRSRIDLVPGEIELRMPASGHVPEKRGIHWVAKEAGPAQIDVETKNIGNKDAPASDVRLTLTRGDKTTITRTVSTGPIDAGGAQWATASFELTPGMHILEVYVNPEKDPGETCEDARPNSACGSMTEGCRYTYYHNNKQTHTLFTDGLPVLDVQDLSVDAPSYATAQPSNASKAEVNVRVTNRGASPAFNLDGPHDDAPPFIVRVSVAGCDCEPQQANITRISPGGTRTVTATLPLHGLTGSYELKVELDPHNKTADLDRAHTTKKDTFPVPTPDLLVWANAPYDLENGAYLVPEQNDFKFQVHVKNDGDGAARTSQGQGVRLLVERDSARHRIHDERLLIGASRTAVFEVQDQAGDLDGEHLYRIRVDPNREILEPDRSGNTIFLRAIVASYGLELELDDDKNQTTVPPGVDGRLDFVLTNQATVTDTFLLETPHGDPGAQHYEDTNGERIDHVELEAEQSARVQLVHRVPKSAADGTRIDTRIHVASTESGHEAHEDVTYVVGPDGVAPGIHLHHPKNGFLGDERIVLEITDNVGVAGVETDLFGTFAPIEPDGDSQRYTLDATGTPDSFTFTVRATDHKGNAANETFTLNRDETDPEITSFEFAPNRGVLPGDDIAIVVNAHDKAMDRVDLQITQPRPGGEVYRENITLKSNSNQFVLQQWTVPERPGHYTFRVLAYDQAGNRDTQTHTLQVNGLNIEILTTQPPVVPPQPQEGERVMFTYQIRNTSPDFETGSFFITFVLDFERQIGLERVNLAPGESRVIQFAWTAEPGDHAFTFVVDQAQEIAEDNEDEEDNLHFTQTGVLFPDQELFSPEMIRLSEFASFGQLVQRYWYLPLALLVTFTMFAAAVVLARRAQAA